MTFLSSCFPKSSEAVMLSVTDIIGDTLCIASEDGQKVYELIAAAFQEGRPVIVNFKNIEETVPACMDTMIAQLYEYFPEVLIASHLSVINANEEALNDIKNAIYWTKLYLEDRERFKKAARESLNIGEDDE